MDETMNQPVTQPNVNTQTSKDDIVHLLHLFKEPSVQRQWSNLHSILKREELDARKSSGPYSEQANPLSYLAELFNNYEEFAPQNVMVDYVLQGVDLPPLKKQPYQPSATEWAYLATFTHDLEPTNLSRRNIIRGEDWIKATWNDCRRYLHQMFINYNRLGQHDDDKDEWGSKKELRCWCRAAKWNPTNSGSGSISRYQSAMIYSIAVLDICDFKAIGRKMPKGMGVDATINNGAVVASHKTRKRSVKQDNNTSILKVLELGDARESKMSALKLLLEF
jgi:hypothetical protein